MEFRILTRQIPQNLPVIVRKALALKLIPRQTGTWLGVLRVHQRAMRVLTSSR